ncbi:hypothetical protein MBLNU459_g2212t1 [Dothideomycetes sp. NU459]
MESPIAAALPGLTASLESALPALPSADSIVAPENGITLLDAKNDIFLAYLQTLALRNLAVIRSVGKHIQSKKSESKTIDQALDDQLVKNLVAHRVYLEKGVRPLEDRLKYQIDKVVRAADDEARDEAQKASASASTSSKTKGGSDDDEDEASDDDDDDDDAASAAGSADELAYRPNPSSFARPQMAAEPTRTTDSVDQGDGIYRPPRISATAMPTTERKEARDRRPMRSDTIDEYVAAELSTAPLAQPSIGSTIAAGGRKDKSAKERAVEAERREYEESNLVRLPKESKKERGSKGGRGLGAYGGEDWRGLGEGVDRIDRLTRRKSGTGGALERSRKRKASEDGQRGDGAGGLEMGGAFERRKKRAMRRG